MTETDFVKEDKTTTLDFKNIDKKIKEYTKLMKEAALNLEFEQAMLYRDKLKELEQLYIRI